MRIYTVQRYKIIDDKELPRLEKKEEFWLKV